MHKKQLYFVSCSELGATPTKEGSAAAANAWWRKKLVEIEANHSQAAHLGELARRRDWAVGQGMELVARNLQGELTRVRAGGEPADDAPILEEAYRAQFGGDPPPAEQLADLYATGATWRDRLGRKEPQADRTTKAQVERYLAGERARVDAGDLSVSELDTVRRCLGMFRDWIGPETTVERIDADRWEGWWLHLVALALSVEYRKKLLRYARSFVTWLAEKGLLSPPPNLHSRRYRFGGGAVAVPTLPIEAVKTLIAEAPGQLKLHLLLMMNCGMGQADIADLAPSEVDWDRGRIKRRRSKTGDRATVPTVEYPLWPPTMELLELYGFREGERVLRTESGRLWVRDEIRPDGKRHKVDAIKSNYVHLAERLKISSPMKLLRKTSASLLETHETFGRYASHFLGHAPRTVADRHYVRPSQDLFDSAVLWLGSQYGLAGGAGGAPLPASGQDAP